MSLKTTTRVAAEEDLVNLEHEPSPEYPKQKAKSRWRWLWLPVLAALAYFGYRQYQSMQANQAAAAKAPVASPSVPVTLSAARIGDIPVILNGLGSVTPYNTVTIKSRIDGQLTRVEFKEGQFVKMGDLLAEIDPRPYQVTLAQGQAQLAKDMAQLNNSKLDLARYQLLAKDGVIPPQQLDTQKAAVVQFEAVIKVDEAQIDSTKLNLAYCRITAPLSGRIGLRLVDVGNMVHAADPNGMLVITQVQPIAVLFTIPEDSLAQVLKRLRAGEHMAVDAYDRSGQNKLASGKLQTVDNQIDQSTGTSRLKAVFDNKDGKLFPNQFVNARLLVETRKKQILIPAVAIQRGPQAVGTFVYVINSDQTAEIRKVNVGFTEGTDTSIDSGLSVGDQVVVDGVDRLRAGSKVVINPASSGARPGS
jgi:multidrug efflux system membrane fusion protein